MIGTVKWRYHSPTKNTVVLDENGEDGELLPASFVYTTRECLDDGLIVYVCTCQTYRRIVSVMLNTVEQQDGEELLPYGQVFVYILFKYTRIKNILLRLTD